MWFDFSNVVVIFFFLIWHALSHTYMYSVLKALSRWRLTSGPPTLASPRPPWSSSDGLSRQDTQRTLTACTATKHAVICTASVKWKWKMKSSFYNNITPSQYNRNVFIMYEIGQELDAIVAAPKASKQSKLTWKGKPFLRRIISLRGGFGLWSSAKSCQDTDFFRHETLKYVFLFKT